MGDLLSPFILSCHDLAPLILMIVSAEFVKRQSLFNSSAFQDFILMTGILNVVQVAAIFGTLERGR